jgi:hypothetical protein
MTLERRVSRLEKIEEGRATTPSADALCSALKGALNVALRDFPNELEEVLAHLSGKRLGDAKDVLEHLTTGAEEGHNGLILTPRAVGGVLHLLMHGALDTRENIADRIREPIVEFCGDNLTLQETIVLLYYDITRNSGVFRDYPVAFACLCLNGGHGFRSE